jgi:hypothetical protein
MWGGGAETCHLQAATSGDDMQPQESPMWVGLRTLSLCGHQQSPQWCHKACTCPFLPLGLGMGLGHAALQMQMAPEGVSEHAAMTQSLKAC